MAEVLGGQNEDMALGVERLREFVFHASQSLPPPSQEALWRSVGDFLIAAIGSNTHPSSNGTITYFPDNLPEIIEKAFEEAIVRGFLDVRWHKKD